MRPTTDASEAEAVSVEGLEPVVTERDEYPDERAPRDRQAGAKQLLPIALPALRLRR